MDDKLPEPVLNLMQRFSEANFQIFLVGGAVRDLLMNRPVSDWDFTTDAKPEEILKLFPGSFYNNKFGTVGIPEKDQTNRLIEITTMRKEGKYIDFRHPDQVAWTNKLEEDLARRDFTINAMALGLQLQLVDPFGGRKDIEQGVIRTVNDPDQRFKEDALRLLRAIRVATELNFEIEEDTFKAIKQNADLINQVSGERIRDEIFKLLKSPNADLGVLKLRESGLLTRIFPELERCFEVMQQGPKHTRVYDIGEHSLATLKHTPTFDPLVKLAALLHDIGKSETQKIAADGNVTFYNHDIVGANLSKDIAKRLRLANQSADKLYRLIRWHLFTVDDTQTDSAIRRFIKNVGVENIDDLVALRIGDRLGGGTKTAVSWRMEKFKDRIKQVLQKPFTVTDLKVNGQDVMEVLNIPPSKKVGEVLNQLFQAVTENQLPNDRQAQIAKIKQLMP